MDLATLPFVVLRAIRALFAVFILVFSSSVGAQEVQYMFDCHVSFLSQFADPFTTGRPVSNYVLYPSHSICMTSGRSWCRTFGRSQITETIAEHEGVTVQVLKQEMTWDEYAPFIFVDCYPAADPSKKLVVPPLGEKPWEEVLEKRSNDRQTLKPPIFVPLPFGPNYTPVLVPVDRNSPTGRFLVELEDVMNRAPKPALALIASALIVGGVVAAVGVAGAPESGGTSVAISAASLAATGAAILAICDIWKIQVRHRAAFQPL
ncbi:MAG: hypothetical protein V1495_07165 [Pseudomonadota bacterium]